MVQDKDEELWVDLYAMWVVLAEDLYPLTCTIPKMLDKNRAWDAHFYTVLRIRPLCQANFTAENTTSSKFAVRERYIFLGNNSSQATAEILLGK